MRVTNNIMIANLLRNLDNSLNTIADYQQQISTGKRITVPSDDPTAASKALALKDNLDENKQYIRNIEDGLDWLEQTEVTIDRVMDLLNEVEGLTMEGSNSVLTQEEKNAVAYQIDQNLSELLALGNGQYRDRYIFSGQKTDTPPLTLIDDPGGDITGDGSNIITTTSDWTGVTTGSEVVVNSGPLAGTYYVANVISPTQVLMTTNVPIGTVADVDWRKKREVESIGSALGELGLLTREVERDVILPVNIRGTEIFQPNGTGQTNDIFQVVIDISDHMRDNDLTALATDIENLRAARENVLKMGHLTGARVMRFETARSSLDAINLSIKDIISREEDADIAEALTRLQQHQVILQAALSAGSKVIQMSLMKFLA
ncbi:flagellar hook-associated protein FlgL [candidate division KSB1 bacterium]